MGAMDQKPRGGANGKRSAAGSKEGGLPPSKIIEVACVRLGRIEEFESDTRMVDQPHL